MEEEEDESREAIETPFDPASVDIFDKKFTISSLLERLRHTELRLTPDFQRRANLWDAKRKSRLIESVLLRIPLPSFYFREDKDGSFEVVDGLQRLCSIFHFIDHPELNKATGARLDALRLEGLQYLQDKTGKSFHELDRPFQRRINELEINVNVIRATTPKAVMFNVFARLNQGGLPLSSQEIRNAIYPGDWRDHVRSMAESEEFRNATLNKVPTERQYDMEMVLRFVSLWALGYPFLRTPKSALDTFLNESVDQTLKHWNQDKWSAARQSFFKGLAAAEDVFGRHAFRKSYGNNARTPINKGLFESQLITLAYLEPEEIVKLEEKVSELGRQFGDLISNRFSKLSTALRSGTGHAESSNARIEALFNLYRSVLNAD